MRKLENNNDAEISARGIATILDLKIHWCRHGLGRIKDFPSIKRVGIYGERFWDYNQVMEWVSKNGDTGKIRIKEASLTYMRSVSSKYSKIQPKRSDEFVEKPAYCIPAFEHRSNLASPEFYRQVFGRLRA